MKLFGNKRESNLKNVTEMVEKVIHELGLSPEENRLQTDDGSPAWGLMRGSAQVYILIRLGDEGENHHTIQLLSPVMRLPESVEMRTALFQRLLELNAKEITSAAFGIKDDTIVIITDRSTEDLDRSEVMDMVLRVGYFSDMYDDALVSQYGGRRYSD